jgi:hypothetical protein
MPRTGRPPVEKIRLNCALCGTGVERYPSQVKVLASGRVFCSKKCRDTLGCKPRRKANKVCEQCGVTFYPINSGGPNRFCSIRCHDDWQRRNREQRTCEVCGAAFELPPSLAANNAGRFCGRECMGVAARRRPLDRMHNGKPALLTPSGYVKVWEPEHPNSHHGWIGEHRLIVATILGRALTPDEDVHHINGVKDDNRPENLEVMDAGTHSTLTTYRRMAREKAEREEMVRKLAEYERRFGALT